MPKSLTAAYDDAFDIVELDFQEWSLHYDDAVEEVADMQALKEQLRRLEDINSMSILY